MIAILLACLISAPTDCRTHEILLYSVTPVQQFLEAQSRAAEWIAKHPGYQQRDLRIERGRAA